ncbi:hypothetical protein NPIL_329151 [Nephila pilipes]|uniref:Uncharacterized protein n=1 Tax=Nephila pilipes TaxID=299642 RepID=A0A8X6QC89_NEPPI|nr:hypothetical protein NPIL_329151 [Nephila pilipes]
MDGRVSVLLHTTLSAPYATIAPAPTRRITYIYFYTLPLSHRTRANCLLPAGCCLCAGYSGSTMDMDVSGGRLEGRRRMFVLVMVKQSTLKRKQRQHCLPGMASTFATIWLDGGSTTSSIHADYAITSVCRLVLDIFFVMRNG